MAFKRNWNEMSCCEKFGSIILGTGVAIYVIGDMTLTSLWGCTKKILQCCKESWEVYDPYGIKEAFREWDERLKREKQEQETRKNEGQTHSQS